MKNFLSPSPPSLAFVRASVWKLREITKQTMLRGTLKFMNDRSGDRLITNNTNEQYQVEDQYLGTGVLFIHDPWREKVP